MVVKLNQISYCLVISSKMNNYNGCNLHWYKTIIWSINNTHTTKWLYYKLVFLPRNHIHLWIFLVCTKPWYAQNEKEILWCSMNIKLYYTTLHYIICCIFAIRLFHKLYTGKNHMINSVHSDLDAEIHEESPQYQERRNFGFRLLCIDRCCGVEEKRSITNCNDQERKRVVKKYSRWQNQGAIHELKCGWHCMLIWDISWSLVPLKLSEGTRPHHLSHVNIWYKGKTWWREGCSRKEYCVTKIGKFKCPEIIHTISTSTGI